MSKFRLDFHLVLVVLLILILPLSLNSSQTHDIVTNISDLPIKDNVISYATSSAINFTSNVDFALQGFSGSGSVEDPYRIENLSIIVDGDCILVRDTTVHFVISNCYLSSVTHDYDSIFDDSAGAGVFLYNVSNCRIVDCIVQYKYYGCEIHRLSSNLLIEDNQISYCFHGGLFSGGASHGEVSENLFTHNFYGIELLGGGGTELTRFFNVSYNTLRYNSYGINCNAADSCIIDHNVVEKGGSGLEGYLYNVTLTNNQIDSMSHSGIRMGSGSSGLFQYNQITEIDGTGLTVLNVDNLTISHNLIEYCGKGIYSWGTSVIFEWNNISFNEKGFELQASHDYIIRNNLFFDNDWYGLYLSGSTSNNSIYYNTFIDNEGYNARDRGDNNTWDDGVTRGNVWDDYIGFGTYIIPGNSGGVDRYPDNPEHGLQYNVILPPIGLGIICVLGIILLYQRRDLIRARLKQSR